MKLYEAIDYQELSTYAANIIADQVRQKPNAILGLATGSTPIGCYQELIRLHQDESLDFQGVSSFNLDEYYGLRPDNPNSYHYYMDYYFFNHININKNNTHIPDGVPEDLLAECQAYDRMASEAGGMDVQILGLGSTGHIAFNEPDNHFHPHTRLVKLNHETIKANGHYFKRKGFMPKKAISVGMRFILNSRLILLLVSSETKAKALAKTINGPVDPHVPASILQLHPNVIIIADKAALSKL